MLLKNLYNSLIEPYLYYCSLIFGGAYDCHVHPLEVIQRRCVRVICRMDHRASSDPLFLNLKILKFKDLYKLQLGIYVYKNPQIIISSQTSHNYYTRNSSSLNPVFQRLTLTKRQSVTYQGPMIWNTISPDIKSKPSLRIFKNHYKKNLLEKYNE